VYNGDMDPVLLLAQKKGDHSLQWLTTQIGDVSKAYLSYVLRRQRPPGPKILNYLGIEKIEQPPIYRKKRA
jgi:hypothetical protein